MIKVILSFALVAAAASAVQVGYVAPVASGYIYRNDHNGPASLINLGAHQYQQPAAFAPPLPLSQPLKLEAIEAYDLAPAHLPYIVAKTIDNDDSEDDDDDDDESDESSDEYLDGGDGNDLIHHCHGHGFEQGEGSDFGEEHHAAHGEKGSKGYESKGHHAKGAAGHYGEQHEEGFHGEGEGVKKSHHDEADAHGKHYVSGGSYEGGDHGHKKHFSKGEDVTGYHKVFNKNEYKKDHDFYDVADNSGHFNKHGYNKAHHGSEEGGHKEGGSHDSEFDKGGFGKAGFHAKGHVDDGDHNHSAEEGHESHYHKGAGYHNKGNSGHQKEFVYGGEEDEE